MKFTVKSIASLKPKEQRYEVYDDAETGFGLRVSPSGNKSWISRYRQNGRLVKYTHGKFESLTLADANSEHKKIRIQLQQGIDPQAEKLAMKTEAEVAPTIEQLVGLFIDRYAKKYKRSWKDDENRLNRHLVPRYGKLKAKDIKRAHIRNLLASLEKQGLKAGANRVFASIRKMFNWAVSQDILEISPCLNISAPVKEVRKDRVLNNDEIKMLWDGLTEGIVDPVYERIIKLVLVTGQRKGEVANIEKQDIDLDSGWWVIPAEKTKNKKLHRVPLSSLAVEILTDAYHQSKSQYLFPSFKTNSKPLAECNINHRLTDIIIKKELNSFTPHDLRRTAATYMASIGIDRLVISKVLNHVEQSITAVYDQYLYDSEKRQALEKWSRFLVRIINGKDDSKVVRIA